MTLEQYKECAKNLREHMEQPFESEFPFQTVCTFKVKHFLPGGERKSRRVPKPMENGEDLSDLNAKGWKKRQAHGKKLKPGNRRENRKA